MYDAPPVERTAVLYLKLVLMAVLWSGVFPAVNVLPFLSYSEGVKALGAAPAAKATSRP